MKKIAYVITDLSYGGAQTMLFQMIKNINYDQFHVEVFVRESRLDTEIERNIESLGIKCHFLGMNDNKFHGPKKLFYKLRNFIRIKKVLDEYRPDIVHSHLESFYSCLYCVLTKTRFLFTVHSFPDRIITKQFRLLLNILGFENKLTIVGCAKCVSDRFIELLGERFKENTVTIYNPIDYELYFPASDKRGNTFIHVGRMDPIKNQALLLEAFAEFVKKHPEVQLLMAGDGPLKSELEKLSFDLGAEDNVKFLGNRSDIDELLSVSDYFVLTSKSECCPMSILEAMASGLPIISTDVGGIREVTKDAAIFAKEKEDFVNAFNELYHNISLRNEMGNKARSLAKEFDAERITNMYLELYQ